MNTFREAMVLHTSASCSG